MFMDKMRNILKSKTFITIIAILLPFFIELIKFKTIEWNVNTIIRIVFVYGVYALIGIFFILKKYSKQLDKIASFIIRKRYIIAGIILVITVLLQLNLSSIDMWCDYVGEPEISNILIGMARAIRSDEWLVQSSMMFGQSAGEDAYKIYNNNIAQGNLNMLMVTTPVKDIVSLGKPLIWGFLLFGQEYGFSFYWMLKIILLLLVSLEISLKITKKDNLLSLTGGIVLAIAPAIMWWLSSAIADGYIFGMATVILFSYYMNNLDWALWKKILLAIGLLICIPAFAFVLYPAFQVPFAFLMAIIMLNDFIPNIKKLTKKDYIIMTITIMGIVGLILRYVLLCWDDIVIMMSTVYPGSRISVGGDFSIDRFISYFANIFFPYTSSIGNPCEPSSYIYPFIGLIFLIIYNIKNVKEKKSNKLFILNISITILYIVYLLWEFIGFGELFAKLTFMSMVPTPRLHVVVGLIGTLLTIMYMKENSNNKILTKLQAVIISLTTVVISYVLIKQSSYAIYFNFTKLEIWSVVLFSMTYFLIRGNKKAWCYVMCIIALVAGGTINPICRGISPITDTKISSAIQEIHKDDKNALWAGNSNITGQYLMANGVNTINGVHTYPDFEWLKTIDPEGNYNEIYNRYAHIHITLGKETNFVLLAADAYQAILTYENIKELKIKYYYTNEKCSEDIVEQFNLEKIYIDDERTQYIYKINY